MTRDILLRYAQTRYEEAIPIVEASIPDAPRRKRAPKKSDFLAAGAMMLPENARYEYQANLPESEDINEAVNEAMRSIEADYNGLAGILPNNYQELDSDLLRELIRVFNKDSVKKLSSDIIGRIYVYFLMKFSMSGAGAQESGEFLPRLHSSTLLLISLSLTTVLCMIRLVVQAVCLYKQVISSKTTVKNK